MVEAEEEEGEGEKGGGQNIAIYENQEYVTPQSPDGGRGTKG